MSTPVPLSPSTSLPDPLGKFSLPPRADIILRSSDSHDFPVQKLYVVDSSLVLGKQIMAATCHSIGPDSEATCVDGETKDTLFQVPVVPVAENHTIISSLLTFVFPVSPILPPTIEQILELLSVAEKYRMTNALTQIRDCASRRDPPFISPENALHVYCLALNYGLIKEMLEAAEITLKSPMTVESLEDKLDTMSGMTLYKLWKYRQRVLSNLTVSLIDPDEFFSSRVYQILCDEDLACVELSDYGDARGIPLWLDQYLDSVTEDLACFDLTTFHLTLSSHVSPTGSRCEHCTSIPHKTIREFWAALTAVVREGIRNAEELSVAEEEIHSQSSISTTAEAFPLPEGLNLPGADVILRSSDLVSFHVHKSILAISSPFFTGLFSLPQPPDGEAIGGLPVVQVSEDAELLHGLFTVLYPIPSAIPDSYEKALALLSASQKYNMTTVQSTIRSEIGRQLPTTDAAFRAYAIAYSKQLIPEIETTALLTLDHPMTFEVIADALPLFEGSALGDLVRFRKRCRDNFVSFFEGFVDGSDNLSSIWFGCQKTKRPLSASQNDKGVLAGWLRDLILQHTESLKGSYTNPLPNPSSLREDFVAALRVHVSGTSCPSCSTLGATEGVAFFDQLNRRISKVRDEEPFRRDTGVSNMSVDLGNPDA
ncbi:hypothetical protein EDB92DRAFT_1611605 [Lactarius akahatsu]|uniref:BTB domain-containing protein n=1 Tax=Lactarius akahatsu TaxID=416441 RepID=A0AAD4LCF8_9AGAM|nr:hypothetical protein EDB92DRAFT_1611605 [Lactarius akahatsu]